MATPLRASRRGAVAALFSRRFYLSIKMFSSSLPPHGHLSSMPWLAHPSIHPSWPALFCPSACLSACLVFRCDPRERQTGGGQKSAGQLGWMDGWMGQPWHG